MDIFYSTKSIPVEINVMAGIYLWLYSYFLTYQQFDNVYWEILAIVRRLAMASIQWTPY